MQTQLEHFVDELCASPVPEAYSCDLNSSSIRAIKTPIPTALSRDLQALGAIFGRDPACLAGDLLSVAIQETIAHLPEHLRKRLADIKRQTDLARLDQEQHTPWCETGGT